ncbi:hypothetical protein ACFLIM_38200 [Nonomuraea sp. M3C6]|uniref:Uncharacterized protein n=1 Tax=Nonomuraea marmarensis TaxID=3351344 RepID=A0ABW7ANR0_9ACTN
MSAIVPVAVGLTTMVMVGSGMAELAEMVVSGVAVAAAVIGAEEIGVPLGVTTPDATTVLLGVIADGATSRLAVFVGWAMSQVTVTVALGVMAPAGVLSSIRNGMVSPASEAPIGPQV